MRITPAFFDGIRELIAGARTTVARGVDLVQVHTNFEIGRRIIQEEQRGEDRAAYGEEVIRSLADRLTGEFGKGFSLSNIRSMRLFYLQNQDRIGQSATDQFNASAIGQSMTGELSILQTASGKSGSSPIRQSLTGESGNHALRPFTHRHRELIRQPARRRQLPVRRLVAEALQNEPPLLQRHHPPHGSSAERPSGPHLVNVSVAAVHGMASRAEGK